MITAFRRLLDVLQSRNAVVRDLAIGVQEVAKELETGTINGPDAAALLRALCAAAISGLKDPQ